MPGNGLDSPSVRVVTIKENLCVHTCTSLKHCEGNLLIIKNDGIPVSCEYKLPFLSCLCRTRERGESCSTLHKITPLDRVERTF